VEAPIPPAAGQAGSAEPPPLSRVLWERRLKATVWVLAVLALLPAIGEWWAHLEAEPWARYAALIPLLLVALAATKAPDASEPPRPRAGLALVVAAVALEAVALVAGPERLARMALPLGALGAALATARPRLPGAWLALWLVPVPWRAVTLARPLAEPLVLTVASSTAHLLAPDLAVGARGSVGTAQGLVLLPQDGGLPLAALASGLGWYGAARLGRGWREALQWALAGGLGALPAQMAAVVLAVPVAAAAGGEAARGWLSLGPASIACTAVILATERAARRGEEPRSHV